MRTAAAFALALLALAAPTFAQDAYPARPIRLVVTAPPGGITDILARIIGDQAGRSLGQPIIVDNKPGAGGNIGTEFVVKSPADGYTMLIVNVGTITVHHWLQKNLPFDTINDLVPVAPVADGVSIIGMHAKLPPKSLNELIEYAKAAPAKLNYGSAGNGTMPHLSAELFAYMTGIELVHVPYKGAAPAAVDIASGQVQLGFIALGSMRAQIQAGQIRVLAVGSRERLAAIPDVPTFAEAGLPGYDVTNWFGVFAPKGTPRVAVTTMNREINRMFDDPKVAARIQEGGMLPMRETPEQFAKRVADDNIKWRDVVKRAGITQ